MGGGGRGRWVVGQREGEGDLVVRLGQLKNLDTSKEGKKVRTGYLQSVGKIARK